MKPPFFSEKGLSYESSEFDNIANDIQGNILKGQDDLYSFIAPAFATVTIDGVELKPKGKKTDGL